MPVGHENVPAARDSDTCWAIEIIGRVTGHPRLAQSHQDLSGWTEFDDLMAFAVLTVGVSDPDIAVVVHGDAVRKHEHAGTETGEQLTIRIEMCRIGGSFRTAQLVRCAARSNTQIAFANGVDRYRVSCRPRRIPAAFGRMKLCGPHGSGRSA